MFASQLWFFAGYYFKKHLTGKLTPKDIFTKRFFRLRRKLPGSISGEWDDEVLYHIRQTGKEDLKLFIRNKLSSDIQVVHQVFGIREYAPVVDEIQKKGQESHIKFIIDAGSNVGYVTIFLKSYFPDAAFLIIEPDDGNMEQARKNILLNKLDNITEVKGGLWPRDTWLELKTDVKDGQEWSYSVSESKTPTSLRGFSFESLLRDSTYDTIDILKIDIEGSEKLLFENAPAINTILRKTRFIVMEIHDDTGARPLIYELLKSNGFTWFDNRELTIGTNTNLLSS